MQESRPEVWWPNLGDRWGHEAGFQFWLENRAAAEQGLGLQVRNTLVAGAQFPHRQVEDE